MFAEPAPTQFDLRFPLGNVGVRIHPFFWLGCLFLAWDRVKELGIGALLLWALCVFVSLIVHEMGHVLAMRWFGVNGHIVLHGFGGLAIPEGRIYGVWRNVFVCFAGPLAQFVFYGLLYAINPLVLPQLGALLTTSPQTGIYYVIAWSDLLWINWWWPMLNLLPIYPLDGGQICRYLCSHYLVRNGVRISLFISIGVAGLIALNSLSGYLDGPTIPWIYAGGQLTAIFFGILAANNIMELQTVGMHGRRRMYEESERLPWERDADWWKSGRRPYDD